PSATARLAQRLDPEPGFCALLFLYQQALQVPLEQIQVVVRANRPRRLPVVPSREEVRLVFCFSGWRPAVSLSIPAALNRSHPAGARKSLCLEERMRFA